MKDIDNLQKRSRKLRDFAETMGSSGLAFTGLVGLLFLAILVWQITAPTFIDGRGWQASILPKRPWFGHALSVSRFSSCVGFCAVEALHHMHPQKLHHSTHLTDAQRLPLPPNLPISVEFP